MTTAPSTIARTPAHAAAICLSNPLLIAGSSLLRSSIEAYLGDPARRATSRLSRPILYSLCVRIDTIHEPSIPFRLRLLGQEGGRRFRFEAGSIVRDRHVIGASGNRNVERKAVSARARTLFARPLTIGRGPGADNAIRHSVGIKGEIILKAGPALKSPAT